MKIFSWGQRSFKVSLVIMAAFIAGMYATLAFRIIKVAVLKTGTQISALSSKDNAARYRRDIVDRNGVALAVNIASASVYANPKKIIDKNEAVIKLKRVLPDLSEDKLLNTLNSDKSFVWVKRNLSPKEQYGINNLGIPGIYFEKEYRRFYTCGKLFSHLIGFSGNDNQGLAGIEKFFDKDLSSSQEDDRALQLSVDSRVQAIVSEELDKTIEEFSALGGVGIVVDVKSGEVLSMVSKPDFDPNNYLVAKPESLFNKATLGAYEIGSVQKAITLAIAIDSGKVTLRDAYDLDSQIKIANFIVKDYHKKEGWRTVPEIFLHSSNIGIAQIVLETGKQTFKSYLRNLGLFDRLKIELPERATPLYNQDKNWSDLTAVTVGYGYGLSISPMHFVQAMVPVVNGGVLHNLTLVKIKDEDKIIGEKVLDESTSNEVNKLLRLVVEKGTGRRAEVPGYFVGGKTGTANKAVNGKYVPNARYSSFIGAFPMVDPKYAVFVMLDNPQGIKRTFGFATAGYTAAQTVGNIVSRVGSLYGIKPYDPESEIVKEKLYLPYTIEQDV